jgi:uncharacterized membrane protein
MENYLWIILYGLLSICCMILFRKYFYNNDNEYENAFNSLIAGLFFPVVMPIFVLFLVLDFFLNFFARKTK